MPKFKNLWLAGFELLLGSLIGFGFLEITLNLNTGLLLKGMTAPAPVAQPLQDQTYKIFYSDSDLFYWQRDLIKPILPEEDRLEAQVHYQTDEFGFPNQPPIPAQVDVVVLGRSYSMGAQSSQPWTRELADETGLRILNLSQTGSDINEKLNNLLRFGLPHKPRWVIVEILPSMDIVGYSPGPPWIIENLPYALIQELARSYEIGQDDRSLSSPIFPLALGIPGREAKFTEFIYYLSALTIDRATIEASRNWAEYKHGLEQMISLAKDNGACTLLLLAPTKAEVYLPLAHTPEELLPVQKYLIPWKLDDQKWLFQDRSAQSDLSEMQSNARASRDLLAELASSFGIPPVDPTEAMMQSALKGTDPFMVYDTHWNDAGHQIVAQAVIQALQNTNCP